MISLKYDKDKLLYFPTVLQHSVFSISLNPLCLLLKIQSSSALQVKTSDAQGNP